MLDEAQRDLFAPPAAARRVLLRAHIALIDTVLSSQDELVPGRGCAALLRDLVAAEHATVTRLDGADLRSLSMLSVTARCNAGDMGLLANWRNAAARRLAELEA